MAGHANPLAPPLPAVFAADGFTARDESISHHAGSQDTQAPPQPHRPGLRRAGQA
jgi:hypothetical protein